MDEDTLDAASSAARSDNEMARIEDNPAHQNYIVIKRESKKKNSKTTKTNHSIRESLSYRIGRHITTAVEKPWRIPFLPITFPVYVFLLGLERLGRRPQKKIDTDYDSLNSENQQKSQRMLLFSSQQMV